MKRFLGLSFAIIGLLHCSTANAVVLKCRATSLDEIGIGRPDDYNVYDKKNTSFGAVLYDRENSVPCDVEEFPGKELLGDFHLILTGFGPTLRINDSRFVVACPFISENGLHRKIRIAAARDYDRWKKRIDEKVSRGKIVNRPEYRGYFGPVLGVGVKVEASAGVGAAVGVFMSDFGPCFLTGFDFGVGASLVGTSMRISHEFVWDPRSRSQD